MEYKEFLKEIKKVKASRHHRVNNSYGTKDAFYYYRKVRPKEHKYVLTDVEFLKIIRTINNYLRELLIAGKDVVLPDRMGSLEIRKFENYIKLNNGEIRTNLPINWDATLKLWHEDKESFNKKTLIRAENVETFKIFYNKNNAIFNNKTFYQFFPNRQLKVRLKENIQLNKIEAFKYGK